MKKIKDKNIYNKDEKKSEKGGIVEKFTIKIMYITIIKGHLQI